MTQRQYNFGNFLMSIFQRLTYFARRQLFGQFNDYLRSCTGVLHVGANSGQEREHYGKLGLNVVWVEPIPAVFNTLKNNIQNYPNQRAIMALVADQDDQDVTLNIASNHGASSSMFDLAGHKDLWPEVHYVDQLQLKSVTLPTLIKRENIDVSRYDALLLDTQGAEFPILKGAKPILSRFRFIQVEAADFEAYAGAAQRDIIIEFMVNSGFYLKREEAIRKSVKIGGYFDLLFERR